MATHDQPSIKAKKPWETPHLRRITPTTVLLRLHQAGLLRVHTVLVPGRKVLQHG